jgi:hypothetical protein
VNALTLQWSDLTKALHEDAEFAAIFLRGVHSFNDLDAISKLDLARSKIASLRTSKECITPAPRVSLLQSYGARLSER